MTATAPIRATPTAATIAALLAIAGIAAVIGGPVLAGAAVGGSLIATRVASRRAEARRLAARRDALPDALDLLVVAVHAGLTPHQAIDVVARHGPGPLRAAFEAIVQRTTRGELLADALAALAEQVGPPAIAATDALSMAQRHGAPLRDAMVVIAAESMRQRRSAAQQAARRLPVLMSFPLVVCVLPAFVLLAVAPAAIAALTSFDRPAW